MIVTIIKARVIDQDKNVVQSHRVVSLRFQFTGTVINDSRRCTDGVFAESSSEPEMRSDKRI
jgi:hypothetical protein